MKPLTVLLVGRPLGSVCSLVCSAWACRCNMSASRGSAVIQIEKGQVQEGDRVLLVEDLATDGGSKIVFVDALRKAGARCDHTFVVLLL